jgi:hypothetical protein
MSELDQYLPKLDVRITSAFLLINDQTADIAPRRRRAKRRHGLSNQMFVLKAQVFVDGT